MAQIHKVEIDLSSMYKHFSWRNSASDILKSVISNIDVDKTPHELVLLVNISPDVGLIIEGNDELTKRVIEADNVEDEVERIAKEIAEKTNKDVVIIELFDGYELAYAIILK